MYVLVLYYVLHISYIGQEEGFIERYIKEVKHVSEAARVKTRLRGIVFSLGQSSPYFGYALALYYGGVLVANKEIEFQNVIMYVNSFHIRIISCVEWKQYNGHLSVITEYRKLLYSDLG